MTDTRPDWDTYFGMVAEVISTRADCRRRRHGAVIVKNRRIVATGYNGSAPGGPSCLAGECPRAFSDVPHNHADYSACIACHAEQNAIAYASRDQCESATIYVTGPPCDMCQKLIAAAGIGRIWFPLDAT